MRRSPDEGLTGGEGPALRPGSPFLRIGRVVVAVFVFLAAYMFTSWIPFALPPFTPGSVLARLGSLACAVAAAVGVWRGTRPGRSGGDPQGPFLAVVAGAMVVGSIGFVLGFFGPILLTPEANQGPLLGIFVTGPLGFLLGGIGGYVAWRRAARHAP